MTRVIFLVEASAALQDVLEEGKPRFVHFIVSMGSKARASTYYGVPDDDLDLAMRFTLACARYPARACVAMIRDDRVERLISEHANMHGLPTLIIRLPFNFPIRCIKERRETIHAIASAVDNLDFNTASYLARDLVHTCLGEVPPYFRVRVVEPEANPCLIDAAIQAAYLAAGGIGHMSDAEKLVPLVADIAVTISNHGYSKNNGCLVSASPRILAKIVTKGLIWGREHVETEGAEYNIGYGNLDTVGFIVVHGKNKETGKEAFRMALTAERI